MQAQSKNSLLLFFVAMGLAFSLGIVTGQNIDQQTYVASNSLNIAESPVADNVEEVEDRADKRSQNSAFVPMTIEEMEEAAKNKEPIRFEYIEVISMNRLAKEKIDFETEIDGVHYAGRLTRYRTEFNYVKRTVTITYQGVLEAQA